MPAPLWLQSIRLPRFRNQLTELAKRSGFVKLSPDDRTRFFSEKEIDEASAYFSQEELVYYISQAMVFTVMFYEIVKANDTAEFFFVDEFICPLFRVSDFSEMDLVLSLATVMDLRSWTSISVKVNK